MPRVSDRSAERAGAFYAALAFLIWGLFPLYWKPLSAVPALEVVAHRTAWGFLTVAAWIAFRRRWPAVRAVVRRPRTMLLLASTAALIALNWLLYIWAVINNHVIQASLGYFINPLVNVLLGVLVLRERLSRAQGVAVTLAAAGVAILTFGYGQFPWIALALALTFGLYGLARKTVAADAVTGLLVETGILTPLAAGYLIVLALRGTGALGGANFTTNTLLVLAGGVTAVPLVMFTLGARRLPLSTVGLFQYISPTCQFLLGVLLYRETFTRAHAVSFAMIWTGLAILAWDLHKRFATIRSVR
jgi:chloramphenicol-sensitive protein RarD